MRKLILFLATLVIGVLLSMPVLADTIVTQYSLDGNNWTDANAYTATSDTKLYYRTYNQTKGIASATKSIRLLVDKQAPTPPIVSYAKNNQWTNSPPVMQWSSSDTGGSRIAKYQYWRSDKGNWQDYGTGTSWTPEQNKNISIKWRAVDGAGNISPESNTVQVKTDNTPPKLTGAATSGAWATSNTITATATDNLSGVQYYAITATNAAPSSGWQTGRSFTVTTNGTRYIWAKDYAGNISASKAATVSKVDRDKPVLKADYTPKGWTRQVVVTATATDASPITYQLKKGNAIVADFGNTRSWQIIENGAYTVTARDAAGNITQQVVTVGNIDRTPPNATILLPSKPRNEAEISVRLWDDLSDVDFVILPDGTKWSPGDQQP